MRTARSLPYGCLCPGGGSVQEGLYRGVSVEGGLCPRGLCQGAFCLGGLCLGSGVLCSGGSLSEKPDPPGQTDTCENITLPQTSFAGGNNVTHRTTHTLHYTHTA